MSPLLKNLIIALVLALLVWLGYMIFFKDSSEPVTEASITTNVAIRDGQLFLAQLKELQTVELESSIIKDPRFESLVDLTVEVEEEPVGRDNPFVPFAGKKVAR